MNSKLLLGALAVLGTVLIPACGGDSGNSPATTAQPQVLDTLAVLAIARAPSETTDPLPVDGGALTLANTNDDTSDPVPVI